MKTELMKEKDVLIILPFICYQDEAIIIGWLRWVLLIDLSKP